MSKGTTISITLPNPLLDSLKKESQKKGMMRSRFIVNILSRWQEEQDEKNPKRPKREANIPHDCPNRNSHGFCTEFQYICNVSQDAALTCAGYPKE